MPAQYDFREGILLEKVVYKDDSCDCGGGWLFVLCLIATWAWGVAWFALFFYCYINHEQTTMWVFIALWLVHMIVVITVAVLTLHRSKQAKIANKLAKEKEEEEQKKIEESKKLRNQLHRRGTADSNNINKDGNFYNQGGREIELQEYNKNDLIENNNYRSGFENSDRHNLNDINTNRQFFD